MLKSLKEGTVVIKFVNKGGYEEKNNSFGVNEGWEWEKRWWDSWEGLNNKCSKQVEINLL